MRRVASSSCSRSSNPWSRSSHRRVIKRLVRRELLNEDFARNLLSRKHSGFSIDNSVRVPDHSSRASLAELAQHIPPKRLQVIRRDRGRYRLRPLSDAEEVDVYVRKTRSLPCFQAIATNRRSCGCAARSLFLLFLFGPEE